MTPLPVSSAPSTSTCQAEYSPQNVHFSNLANAQDTTTLPSSVSHASTGARAGDGIDHQQPNVHARSYLQTAARPKMSYPQNVSQSLDGNLDVVEGVVHTHTRPGSHLRSNSQQKEPFVRPRRPHNPLPSTKGLRTCQAIASSTKQTAAPKKAVIHDARTTSETDRVMQAAPPNRDANTDGRPHRTDERNRVDPTDRLKAKEVKQSLRDALIKAMKTEEGDSNKIKLTEQLDAIIDKLVKPGSDTDMTAIVAEGLTEEEEDEERAKGKKRQPLKCPTCAKYKQSPSDLK